MHQLYSIVACDIVLICRLANVPRWEVRLAAAQSI